MKVSILQENLSKGLNIVNRFILAKAQLPILNNVLIKTENGQLRLTATNLETGINLWLGAKIEKEGEICVPAKKLSEYISLLPPQKINLEVEKNFLKVISEDYKANFISLSPSEFPLVPTLKKKPEIFLLNKELSLAISQVAFAVAQDESRPALTGILFKLRKNKLILVATDGFRLSLKEIEGLKKEEELNKLQEELIIPARALIEVGKVISEGEKEINLGLTITSESNQIIFSTPEIEIISRLIEGKFPDFEKIIPNKNEKKIIIETESLLQAVRAASIFAREAANIIRFEIKESNLEVIASNPQLGENKITLEVKNEGIEGKIAFNSRYLLDFLNSVKSDLISFEMTTSLNPGIFRPLECKSYLHIIMPIRLQE